MGPLWPGVKSAWTRWANRRCQPPVNFLNARMDRRATAPAVAMTMTVATSSPSRAMADQAAGGRNPASPLDQLKARFAQLQDASDRDAGSPARDQPAQAAKEKGERLLYTHSSAHPAMQVRQGERQRGTALLPHMHTQHAWQASTPCCPCNGHADTAAGRECAERMGQLRGTVADKKRQLDETRRGATSTAEPRPTSALGAGGVVCVVCVLCVCCVCVRVCAYGGGRGE
jgi:hypothetical protein